MSDVDYLMGRSVTDGATAPVKPPTVRAARRALSGSPAVLAAVHSQAGRVLGPETALAARLRVLRGRYPVVINVWAAWCAPCRAEFSLFAAASASFGKRVAFLGVDTNDNASDARSFLASHPVSYPSYQSSSTQLASLADIEGTPTTIYVDRSGKVVEVHDGQYATRTSLQNDIEHYALGVAG
jgi:thiol-disulfide isomerase/thioredoxin